MYKLAFSPDSRSVKVIFDKYSLNEDGFTGFFNSEDKLDLPIIKKFDDQTRDQSVIFGSYMLSETFYDYRTSDGRPTGGSQYSNNELGICINYMALRYSTFAGTYRINDGKVFVNLRCGPSIIFECKVISKHKILISGTEYDV